LISERLYILETSFAPSDGAEGGHGFKRDPRGPGRHEPLSPGESRLLRRGTAWVRKGKDIWDILV